MVRAEDLTLMILASVCPGLDGFQVIAKMKEFWSSTPVTEMTGRFTEEVVEDRMAG